jgi:3-oxoacyl-[acyl-carrier-protein] synthase II
MQPIYISALSSISALGSGKVQVWQNYQKQKHFLSRWNYGSFVGQLSSADKAIITKLKDSQKHYKNLDLSVLYAIYVSRKSFEESGWKDTDDVGVNIGSSRGATGLFESYHKQFLAGKKLSPLSSPTTTLGNISSWVSQDLHTSGPNFGHSVTCSSGLHAILNGVAWMQSGLCDKFIAGGSEAPLTEFTLAQMQALGIYSQANEKVQYPCRSMDQNKEINSMVLGEGAAVACLQKDKCDTTLAGIIGVGYASETIIHNTSISNDAKCIQRSMRMALRETNPNNVDVIITHTPGTIAGDNAEINAIKNVFKDNIPALTCNKWKIGHTLGASGMLSLELALLMMENQSFVRTPFYSQNKPKKIQTILINAVGFGGNAVSILLSVNK